MRIKTLFAAALVFSSPAYAFTFFSQPPGVLQRGLVTSGDCAVWAGNMVLIDGPCGDSGGPFLPLSGGAMFGNIDMQGFDISGGGFIAANFITGSFFGDGSNISNINGGNVNGLATVAHSGNYGDLSGAPFDSSGNATEDIYIPNGLILTMNGSVITDGNYTSIDPLDRVLYNSNQSTVPINYSGILGNASLSFDSSNNASFLNFIVDTNDINSIDANNRFLFYENGTIVSIDYGNGLLLDTSGTESADYASRHLLLNNTQESLDWGNSSLIYSNGNTSIYWETSILANSAGVNIEDYSGNVNNSTIISFDAGHNTINLANIPTSCSGLPTGDIANILGVLTICP